MVTHHLLHVAHADLAVGLHVERHHVLIGPALAIDEGQVGIHTLVEAVEVTPHAGVAATQRAGIKLLINGCEGEVGILTAVEAFLLGKRDDVLAVHDVLLVLHVKLPDAGVVGVSGNAVIGDAHGYPNGTEFVRSLADHVHNPNLVGVTNREGLTLAGIAVLGHQFGHHLDGLTGGLGALQGDVDEAAIVDDGLAIEVPEFLTAAPSALGDGHLVLVHVAHDGIGVGYLGDGTHALAAVPVDDFAHSACGMVGSGQVLQVTEEGVAVGGIGDDGRAVGTGVLAHQQVGARVGGEPSGQCHHDHSQQVD